MVASITTTNEKHVSHMIKDLRKSCKQFIVFLLLNLAVIIVFSLLFFYIEHCYDPVTPPDPLQPYVDVCRYIQNNTNYSQTDTQLTALCKQALNHKPKVVECTLNKKNFFKYFDYYVSVVYTLGELCLNPNLQICRKKAVWRSVFLIIQNSILNANSTKTHSSRDTF